MLRVTALELPHRYDQSEVQWSALEAWPAAHAASTDLVLLAETALTGYLNPRGLSTLARFAEPLDGPTIQRATTLATKHGVELVVPLVERDGPRLFNAMVWVSPDGGVRGHYRKRHPWYPETWATPGDLESATWVVRGLRLAIAVCFDIHFVSDDQGAVLDAADALLFPSAWVDDDADDARGPLLEALAQRHGIAVVNANWGPGRPRVRGQGGSRILDRDGALRALARPGEGFVQGEIAPRGIAFPREERDLPPSKA